MQRRDFLKGSCRICLLGLTAASVAELYSCSPSAGQNIMKSEVVDNKMLVPIKSFDAKPFQIVSSKKYPFEIAVQKKDDGSYEALLLKCTHYDNQLQPTGNGYTCNFHGSKFDKDGKVLKGPAASPLTHLKVSQTSTEIYIHLI